jgi:ADP-ribose pyrophosphatase YjhB (NUDIX family)
MIFKLLRLAYVLRSLWTWFVRPVILGVRMVLLQDGKVLLVRHTYMEGWHLPGGAMKRGESPLEAAAREAREEAGVELLEPPQLVGIFTSYAGGRSDHVATYVCRRFRVHPAPDKWEIAECQFFAVDALPPQFGAQWQGLVRNLVNSHR